MGRQNFLWVGKNAVYDDMILHTDYVLDTTYAPRKCHILKFSFVRTHWLRNIYVVLVQKHDEAEDIHSFFIRIQTLRFILEISTTLAIRVVAFELVNPQNSGSRIYMYEINSTTQQPDTLARI